MSCDLRTIRVISRWALPLVLTLIATPSAFAQSTVCHPIRGGETAAQLARRITGDARNVYQPSFQIMDASSRFVPKSQYNRIRRGWRACIVKETVESQVESRVEPAARVETLEAAEVPLASQQAVNADIGPSPGSTDLTFVWLGAAVVLPLVGWKALDNYASRRKTSLIVMKHFAHRFVREFERPLIQHPPERPVRSLVRLSPVRSRLDILLAPGEGRRYPNLADHKKNVEYDVVRILRVLADDSFVRDPLYTQEGWVVVPFRFKVSRKHTGAA
jgi:hypothetical protein